MYQQAELGEGEWLVGFGYDHNRFCEKRHPDASVLDKLNIPNPVIIAHASGHMGVVNSRALEAAGICADTPDPSGGRFGRIPGTQEPNGYAEEAAFLSLSAYTGRQDTQKSIQAMTKAQQLYASYGITTIQDGLVNKPEWELLKHSELFLDVVGYVDIHKSHELLLQNPEFREYRSHLKLAGYKLILDGSPQGRTAWLTEPYENAADGYKGYPVYQDEEVTKYLEQALQEGVQILVHCNGDAAAEQMIRCYRQARERTACYTDIRPVMIHAQMLRKDLLGQVKELGIIPSFFVAHTYYWGDVHLQNLGNRAHSISPAHSAEEHGIPYTFHQDSPVLKPDMLKTIWCAVNRRTQNGVLLGGEERITPLEALKAVTIHAAAQYGEETYKGSIATGKQANFVVLDQNPLRVLPEEIDRIQVLQTIVRDQVVYEREEETCG